MTARTGAGPLPDEVHVDFALAAGKPRTRRVIHMKFLAVSTNTKDVSPFIAAELQRLNELRAAGAITGAWVKADFSGAALILECANAAEATAALNTLPSVANDATGVVLTEIIDLDSVQAGVG
jgi:hypothetical protein